MKKTVKLILTAILVLLALCVCSGAVSAADLPDQQFPQWPYSFELESVTVTPTPHPLPAPGQPDYPEPVLPVPPGNPAPSKTEGEIITYELSDYLLEYCWSLGMTDDQVDVIYNLLFPIIELTGIAVDGFHIPISVDDACDRLAVLVSFIYDTFMT